MEKTSDDDSMILLIITQKWQLAELYIVFFLGTFVREILDNLHSMIWILAQLPLSRVLQPECLHSNLVLLVFILILLEKFSAPSLGRLLKIYDLLVNMVVLQNKVVPLFDTQTCSTLIQNNHIKRKSTKHWLILIIQHRINFSSILSYFSYCKYYTNFGKVSGAFRF